MTTERTAKLPFYRLLHPTPRQSINAVMILGVLIFLVTLWLATDQPQFNLPLTINEATGLLEVSATPDATFGDAIEPGFQLKSVTGKSGEALQLHTGFVTALPKDRRKHYPGKAAYFEDRAKLYRIMQSPEVTLEFTNGVQKTIAPQQSRPVTSLSSGFWIRLIAGLVIWISAVSIWVWQPKRPELAALGLSSTGMMLCALGQSLYADIPNIFSPGFDWWLNFMINVGLIWAGWCMVTMVLYYPVRIVQANRVRNLLAVLTPLLVIALLIDWGISDNPPGESLYISDRELYVALIAAFATGLAMLLWQSKRHWSEPNVRRRILWALAIVTIGPTAYVLLRVIPALLDSDPVLSRDLSWVMFTLAYLGVLLAVARFNLFELGRHVTRTWRWIILAIVFLSLDLIMANVFRLSLEQGFAIVVTLALLLYISFRQKLYAWLGPDSEYSGNVQFAECVRLLLEQAKDEEKLPRDVWSSLLTRIFNPLSLTEYDTSARTGMIQADGKQMIVPANQFAPALCLEFADQGERSFEAKDLATSLEIASIYELLMEHNHAYLAGRNDERNRIRRDIHDQVGHTILGMIHNSKDTSTRDMAQQILGELQVSLSNLKPTDSTLSEVVSEIENTCKSFFPPAGIKHAFTMQLDRPHLMLNAEARHGILSILRELSSNIVKHSQATEAEVSVRETQSNNSICIVVKDNGNGFLTKASTKRSGLLNIEDRARSLNGILSWNNASGTEASVQFDVDALKLQ